MKCMFCGCIDSKVIDSRLSEDGTSIRRRRECIQCGKRFTTYEKVEYTPIMVVKKSGNRQAFDIQKIRGGVLKAFDKRPTPMIEIEKLIANIEKQVYNSLEQEITSSQIGEMIMGAIKDVDQVAYVRFASVYRQFKDINSLFSEIEDLIKLKENLEGKSKNPSDKK